MTSTPQFEIPDYPGIVTLTCFDHWDIILTHEAGQTHFVDDWNATKHGFSDDQTDEYYLGNQPLFVILGKGSFLLRIDMWTADGEYMSAEYSDVSLTSDADGYALHIGAYDSGTSTAGGLVTYHSGNAFTTYDSDTTANGCTGTYPAAWWYLQNTAVSILQDDGSVQQSSDECFTSLLTADTGMTWALENKNGEITGHVPVDKVVMRVAVNPEVTFRKY